MSIPRLKLAVRSFGVQPEKYRLREVEDDPCALAVWTVFNFWCGQQRLGCRFMLEPTIFKDASVFIPIGYFTAPGLFGRTRCWIGFFLSCGIFC